jgi:hypothetical protein
MSAECASRDLVPTFEVKQAWDSETIEIAFDVHVQSDHWVIMADTCNMSTTVLNHFAALRWS